MIAEPRMERAGTGNMCEQVLHLVGENFAALEINVLGVSRCERYCNQLQCSLLRRPPTLMIISAATSRRDIVPDVLATM